MRAVSVHIFYNVHWFIKRVTKTQVRLRICAVWSEPSLPAVTERVFYPYWVSFVLVCGNPILDCVMRKRAVHYMLTLILHRQPFLMTGLISGTNKCDWLIEQMNELLIDWMIYWLAGCLLTDCLIGDWLIDWSDLALSLEPCCEKRSGRYMYSPRSRPF